MTGRLNAFQKAMVQWNELHAYNAVHVVRIPRDRTAESLQSSIHATLENRGLTFLTLDRASNRFTYEGSRDGCEIQVIENEDAPVPALVAEVGRQLNRRFPGEGRFCPFRFMIVSAGDSFFLGLVYFHPVADAESVVLLLKDIVVHHRREGAPGFSSALELYPDSRAHLLFRHPAVVIRRMLGLPAQVRQLRQSHRIANRDAHDLTNGFAFFAIETEALDSLMAAARDWQVSVNDMFLALLMKSLSPCAGGRVQSRKRNQVSVGCIVNTRRQVGVDGRSTFGLFLGSFMITHQVPDGISLRELADQVSLQTTRIKQDRLYLGTALELGVARFALTFFSPHQRRSFYPKNWPLLGGVTNMNLNGLWEQDNSGVPLDYFRGVSTGPVTPLVLSVTTTGDRANIGLSYRTSVFSPGDIEDLRDRFFNCLGETRLRP